MKGIKTTFLISISICILTFAILGIFPKLYKGLEWKSYDLRMLLKLGQEQAPPNIVIVDVDDKSIKKLGRYQLWPRYYFAQVLDNLENDGAKFVGIDFIFSEPDTIPELLRNIYIDFLSTSYKDTGLIYSAFSHLTFDKYFASTMQKYGNVILPIVLKPTGVCKDTTLKNFSLKNIPPLSTPVWNGVLAPIDTYLKSVKNIGFINVFPSSDGVIRKVYLFWQCNSYLFPSFPLSIVLSMFKNYAVQDRKLLLPTHYIPLQKDGSFLINYYGGFKTFPYISFSDVFFQKFKKDYFKDKIVIIGSSAPGLYDLRNTPTSGMMPGAEIHSTALANILTGRVIRPFSTIYLFILSFLMFFFVVLISIKFKPSISGTFLLIIIFAYTIFSFYIFIDDLIWIELVRPLAGIILSFIWGIEYRITVVEKEKKKMKQVFSRYVPGEVVEEITSREVKLGGERKEVTVLFSDIRNFTAMSEKKDPALVVQDLNEYFELMSKIIFTYNGMIDKYLGDGIMAIFGAPISYPGHADKSVLAALDMVAEVRELKKRWEKIGKKGFDIGIGINSGEAIIGNIGAERRMDYTAIGDIVNLAARLEPLNKEFGTNIIISESTRRRLKIGFNLRDLGKVRVKGKEQEVNIYEVLGKG